MKPPRTDRARSLRRRWNSVLMLPFIFLLWPALYARDTPELFGFPFFYWYLFFWVILSSMLTLLVYRKTRNA